MYRYPVILLTQVQIAICIHTNICFMSLIVIHHTRANKLSALQFEEKIANVKND